jgi:hypothetical protein
VLLRWIVQICCIMGLEGVLGDQQRLEVSRLEEDSSHRFDRRRSASPFRYDPARNNHYQRFHEPC